MISKINLKATYVTAFSLLAIIHSAMIPEVQLIGNACNQCSQSLSTDTAVFLYHKQHLGNLIKKASVKNGMHDVKMVT